MVDTLVEAMRANALVWRERKRLAAITIEAGWRGLQGRRKAERRRLYLIEMERRVALQIARHNAVGCRAASSARPSVNGWCTRPPSHLRLSSLPI